MPESIAKYCGFKDSAAVDSGYGRVCELVKIVAEQFSGLDDIVALLVLCFLAPERGGSEARRHVLLEGAAGTAKTALTRIIAAAIRIAAEKAGISREEFKRVQGVPDLLPSSFIGMDTRDKTGGFSYSDGPILKECHVFHVDEINRIPSRTLAVLLEAMAEQQVTLSSLLIDEKDRTRKLPWLFVVGTQNPGSFVGTNPLPEPLLDRFMIRVVMPYPDKRGLVGLLQDPREGWVVAEALKNVPVIDFDSIRLETAGCNAADAERAAAFTRDVAAILLASWPLEPAGTIPNLRKQLPIDSEIRKMIDKTLEYGLGARAGQALRDLSCAVAWCRSRGGEPTAPSRDDLAIVAPYVLGHRLRFQPQTLTQSDEQSEFVRRFLKQVWQWRESESWARI